jgi:hypothetical protein
MPGLLVVGLVVLRYGIGQLQAAFCEELPNRLNVVVSQVFR